MNDFKLVPAARPSGPQAHISEREADRLTQQDDVPELVEFVLALKMRKPISTDKAARLLKHLVKQQMASDTSQIADQMRDDGWEECLSGDETLTLLAERILAYLDTHEGTALFNFFVRTFARTSGEMFD